MSLMDKIRSFFSGGAAGSDAGHDHSHAGHDHPPEPNAPTVPTDPVGTPVGEPADEDEPR